MKVIEKMSGRKIIRPETSGERLAEKQDKAHKARLGELRHKAFSRLAGRGIPPIAVTITQIGCRGFYWKQGKQTIPIFELWAEATIVENRKIFNVYF